MRFFASDGTTVHGPSALEEILKLPGFDGDTLVCPAGSEDSADWKPALAYPPFREALLAPKEPPLPPAAEPTEACPRCLQSNPAGARFCCACAGRMDGVEDPPPPSKAPAALRVALLSAAVGAAAGGTGVWLLRRPAGPPTAPEPVAAAPRTAPPAEPLPAAPAPPAPAPVVPAASVGASPVPSYSAAPPKKAARAAKRAARKARAKKPAPEPSSSAPAEKPAAPAPPPSGALMLPGVPKPVQKSAAKTPAAAPASDANGSNAAAPADGGAIQQVREQFEFCTQLLSQAAYADYFDTCLCADARQAAPYRGRRDVYAAALAKAAKAGTLATSAKIASVSFDGGAATVAANWKTDPADPPSTETERWKLEDGLWCRGP